MFQEKTHLSHSITSLLRSSTQDDAALIEGMEFLAGTHGKVVFDEFFHILTQTKFGPEKAFSHWNNVISHRDSIITSQYHHQGLLPSIIHYLQKKTGVISDPRFLESDYIDNIQRSSVTDGLTGLYNQTFFKNSLAKQISQVRRHGGSLSLIIFDLDHFKRYNDTFGHLAGDHALKQTATIIKTCLRDSDIATRYGGEEFALILPHTAKAMALKVANRIRLAVERASFREHDPARAGGLTLSGGVAEYSRELHDVESMIETADRELYIAKGRRNCISPDTTDRRRDNRRPVKSLVECALRGESMFRPALSMTISEVGMAIGCDWGVEVASPVRVKFRRPYWTDDIDLNATVRLNKRVGDMNLVGMEFDGGFSGDLGSFRPYLDISGLNV
jgi:diguanylate cyclase (GGDEF)-like protein